MGWHWSWQQLNQLKSYYVQYKICHRETVASLLALALLSTYYKQVKQVTQNTG